MFEHLTDQACQERFGRSAPWHELVEVSALEDVAWRLSRQAGAPTLDIHAAFRAVWAWIRPDRAGCCWRGWTEPLRLAVPRLGAPREGPVYLLRDPYESRAMLLDMSDLIFFEELLWGDDAKIVDVDASWALIGCHDWEGQFADFRPRR